MRAVVVATAMGISMAGQLVAQAATTSSSGDADAAADAPSSAAPGKRDEIGEVVVTAQKREERLQDVPVPVTALNADSLVENNQTRLADYFSSVPGLSLNAGDNGQQSIAIRGITTGSGNNPTVGVVIDDVPFGSSTSIGNGSLLYPDIDPAELSRIEVLRGPQGTLYGASSLGGLIKFETKDPSTAGFSGRVQVQGSSVDSGQAGYGARGSVNIPLTDSLAVRASGYFRRDPGYIDNVLSGEKDANRANVYGGRLAGLWRPADWFTLKLSALLQNTAGNGSSSVDSNVDAAGHWTPTYGDLTQARMVNTNQFYAQSRLYSAVATAKFTGFDVTSITGYSINSYYNVLDDTAGLGGAVAFYFPGSTGATLNYSYRTQKTSQELRFSSNSGEWLDWLVGAFFTHESTGGNLGIFAADRATGTLTGLAINYDYPTSLSEYSGFADLTAHFTDQFDVQVGGRESWTRQVYNETDTGVATPDFYYGNPSPYVNPTQRLNDNSFTYLVTPRYRISPDLMLYTRFTSGYRMGGNNVNAIIYKVQPQYAPDKTNNYEFGVKGDLFNRALTFDASVYYIQWKDIQVTIVDPTTLTYFHVNGGKAKSEGVEFSVQARPIEGMRINAAASFNDSELTQNLPSNAAAFALSGDRLPYSSRFTANLAVEQDIVHVADWTGFAGASFTYVGDRQGQFSVLDFYSGLPQQRLRYPGYGQLDLRAGARDDVWTVNLFANNVTNKRGIVGGDFMSIEPGSNTNVVYIQPRTIGVSVGRSF